MTCAGHEMTLGFDRQISNNRQNKLRGDFAARYVFAALLGPPKLAIGDRAIWVAASVIERSLTSPTGLAQGDHTAAWSAGEPACVGASINRNPAAWTIVPIRRKASASGGLKIRMDDASPGPVFSRRKRVEVFSLSDPG